MAVELEKFIKDQLENLPQNHPDREYLSGLLADTESYNAGDDRDVILLTDIDQKEVRQAVKEYKSKPHTPELVTQVFQTIWSKRGKFVGKTYEVSPCPYTQEGLTNLEKKVRGRFSRRVGHLPAELATQQRRHILGKMFPQMKSLNVQKNNPITNDKNPSGWFDYETKIGGPYFHTDERLLSLNQYIVAGYDSKLITGRYLDEKELTWTRLGSRIQGIIVSARFWHSGQLAIGWPSKCGGGFYEYL